MHTMYRRIALGTALLTVAAANAGAQPATRAPAGEDALPLYRVEIIVFANNEGDPNEEWFAHELAKSRRPGLAAEARPTPRIVDSPEAAFGSEEAIVLDSLSIDELTRGSEDGAEASDPNALLDEVLPGAPPGAVLENPAASDPAALETVAGDPADELDVSVRYRTAGNVRTFRFRVLEPGELELGSEYARLARLSAYRPLVHGGWVQEGLPEQDAHPFDLVYLGAQNPRGTIQLHLSRFLHVTLDLDYLAPGGARGPSPGGSNVLGEVTTTPRYPLETQRRLRSGELHYIDHPMFGVLVRVTPAASEAEIEDAGTQTPAA